MNEKKDEIAVKPSFWKRRGKIPAPKQPTVPFSVLLALFRFATRGEIIMNVISLVFAAAAGCALPFSTVVFGGLINAFGEWTLENAVPHNGDVTYLITGDALVSQVGSNAVYFLYLGAGSFVATTVYTFVFVYTAQTSAERIRKAYLAAVLRQNIAWFDDVGPGEVATRITTDTFLIQDGIGEKLPLALTQLFTFMAGMGIAFWKSYQLTLMLLTVIPLIAASGAVMATFTGRFQARILDMYAQAGSTAEETLAAVRTVIAFGAQKKMSARYNTSLTGARAIGIQKSWSAGFGLSSLFFFVYCSYSLAFYYGYHLLDWNLIDAGQIVNVFFSVLIGAFALGNIAPDLEAFTLARSAAPRIFAAIDRVPPIDPYNTQGKTPLPEELKGRLEVKQVRFAYPARPDLEVLKGIDLVIEPGSTVALVGESGSGKSTIIQLVERFYDPASGSLELDGVPYQEYNLAWLRRQIGLVSQEPVLFEGSVFTNVCHGLIGTPAWDLPEAERRQLVTTACIEANAHEFIIKLPQSYDTQVGERAILLSGGQKQRIAIARAIIKNPKFLLLDEATSALDTASERIVQAALDRVSASRTTIMIAHRLSTVVHADKIVVMVRGNITEQGNHQSLVALGGLYSRLVEAQNLNKGNEKPADTAADEKDANEVKFPVPDAGPDSAKNSAHDLEKGKRDFHEVADKMSFSKVFYQIMVLNSPELKYIIPALVASMGAGMIYPFFAIAFASILQVFQSKGATLDNDASTWALYFLILAICTWIFYFFQNAFFGFAAEYLTERIRKLLFSAILRQDASFFDDDRHSVGVLTSNLSSDAQRVQGASGAILGSIIQILTTIFGGVLVALIYGWQLALVATTCLPLLVAAGYARIAIVTFFSSRSKKSYERSAQLACEAVAAIRTVQSLTRERQVYDLYCDQLALPIADGFKNAWTGALIYSFSQVIGFFVNALVFYYGGWLIAYNSYNMKQMFTVFVAIIFGSQGAGRIFAFAPSLTLAKQSGALILQLLWLRPLIDSEAPGGSTLPEDTKGQVEFCDVRFNYPTRPNLPVLRGLNLTVKPGQFAAIVGPSGSGKSTTIGLIERFYNPNRGQILVDGVDVSSLNVANYRKRVGLVSQEPQLFDLTVAENIAFGLDSMPDQRVIEQAAKEANIHNFILTLPEGYQTKVGAKGGQLSGGQKQRIAIARALVRGPRILLLDEATSALDAESEKVVQVALDQASKGRTTIAIAHRLSTIQHADVIFVLKDGVVAESGNHKDLYDRKGLYYELVIQQDLEAKK